jgi:cellulose biosynthesis protein BcsQ
MSKIISLFNHKGGVSKTTTTFNLGWMLASKGKKVILVDTDPQCNLTGLVLGYQGQSEFENFYTQAINRNIRDALLPAFESEPKLIEPVDCFPVKGMENLYLLPGHIRLAEYEVTLGIALDLSNSIQTLKNLPGSIYYLLSKTAEKYDADYILVDMSPSLNAINQNVLMISDFFMVPCSPDYFSVMAVDSLASIIPKWAALANKASTLPILQQATYPYPALRLKFLGTIIQKYRPRGGSPSQGFQNWIDQINKTVEAVLIPALEKSGLIFQDDFYQELDDYKCLGVISDFNSLIAKSQEHQTPVFALTQEQLNQYGKVYDQTVATQENFRNIFDQIATRIMHILDNAEAN